MSDSTDAPSIDGRKNNWSVWRTVDKLELKQDNFYPKLTAKVIQILKEWGLKWQGDPTMATTLNKSTLRHEIEEAIVAVHFLFEGLDRRPEKTCHVLDLCAGKGMLSFLISYLKHPKISSIVMLEKATIDWSHIEESNKTAHQEQRPSIDIWKETNLHDYDEVLDRMLALPHPIAMCGIHLCKQLGPSFCGLYNGLGRKTIYGCLSPCCMPRAVTTQKKNSKKRKIFTISVQQAETIKERLDRRDYMLRRERLRRKVKRRWVVPVCPCTIVLYAMHLTSLLTIVAAYDGPLLSLPSKRSFGAAMRNSKGTPRRKASIDTQSISHGDGSVLELSRDWPLQGGLSQREQRWCSHRPILGSQCTASSNGRLGCHRRPKETRTILGLLPYTCRWISNRAEIK